MVNKAYYKTKGRESQAPFRKDRETSHVEWWGVVYWPTCTAESYHRVPICEWAHACETAAVGRIAAGSGPPSVTNGDLSMRGE